MLLSYHGGSTWVLYFLVVIVSSTSKDSLERADDVSSLGPGPGNNNGQNNGRDHERKAFKIHKGLPVPGHGMTTTTTSTTSTLSVSTVNLTTLANQSSTSATSSSSSPSSQTPAGPTFHPITAPSTNDTCQFLLQLYGKLASRLTNCAIVHAKPFLFCENCVREYVETLEAYEKITSEKHHNCKDTLLSSDRVQIVNQLHEFVLKLWDDGNCDTCFEDVNACHYNKTCSLSPETRHFMDSYRETMDCFDEYHITVTLDLPATAVNNVCRNCSKAYQELNEKYEETGPLDKICMDVVELMNHTRIKWSSEFKCIQFKRDVGSVIALGAFVGVLPIFFYCGVRVHAVKQERKFLKEKRLSCAHTSIQHPSGS